MKFQPRVSIIIPVYNGSNFLKEAIESAINQTYKNIEIIIVNDGSKDDNKTENIALSYGNKIKYIKKENGGVASALNLGIKNMSGEYFSWLSHDDLYTPNKVKHQIEKIKELEDKKTLICCRHCVVSEDLKRLYENSFESKKEQLVYPALGCLFKGYIHGCGLLIHKSHFDRVGLFNEKLPTTQDYDLWFRMLRKQKVYLNDNCDVLSRSHDEQGSKKYLEDHIKECDLLWINIINTLTEKEKTEISGSTYKFYKEIYEFLNIYTQYKDCITYVKRLYSREIKKEIIKDRKRANEIFPSVISENFLELLTNEKKKTRIIIGDYGDWGDKGGLNRVVANISNRLSEFYEVYIIASGEKSLGYQLNDKVNYIDMNIIKIHNGDINELSLLLLTLQIDIHIGVHNCSKYILEIYRQLKKDNIKNIAWNHEFYFIPYWNTSLGDVLKDRLDVFKQLEAVFWLTSFNEKVYSNIGSNGIVMENPISWEKPEDVEYERNEKNIISIARFNDPRKCLDKLLEVFSIVLKTEPDAKLYVVGQYDLDIKCNNKDITIRELLTELKIPSENIIFTGFLSNTEELLKKMNVNVITSYHEGFGLIITETGMYKIPTIAYDDSGFEDLINENYNGFLTQRSDDNDMASKIVELLNNKTLCKRMGQNAFIKCDDYLPEKIIDKWKKVLDKIVQTDNQEELNKFYKENYPVIEVYDRKFVKNIINQYETAIQKIINSYNKPVYYTYNTEISNLIDSEKNLHSKIKEMNESTSWKITRPARVISAYAKTYVKRLKDFIDKDKGEKGEQ